MAGTSEATTIGVMDPWIGDRRLWEPGYYIQTWANPLDPDPDPGDPMAVAAEALREKGLAGATESFLPEYLGLIEQEMKRATYRLCRNRRRVRQSIDWLVGKVLAETSSGRPAVRTIFNFDSTESRDAARLDHDAGDHEANR